VQAVIVAHWARITESEGAMNSADRIILPAIVIGFSALWIFSVAAQTITARMAASTAIETSGSQDGHEIGRVTYEVSADHQTLTSKYSTNPSQVLVFDRRP